MTTYKPPLLSAAITALLPDARELANNVATIWKPAPDLPTGRLLALVNTEADAVDPKAHAEKLRSQGYEIDDGLAFDILTTLAVGLLSAP